MPRWTPKSDFYLELELDSELGESTAKGLNQITSGIKKLVDNSMEGVSPENFSPGMESGNYGEERLTSRVSTNGTSVTPRYEVVAKMVHSIYEDTW